MYPKFFFCLCVIKIIALAFMNGWKTSALLVNSGFKKGGDVEQWMHLLKEVRESEEKATEREKRIAERGLVKA